MLSEYIKSVLMCCALACEDVTNVSHMKADLCTVKLMKRKEAVHKTSVRLWR